MGLRRRVPLAWNRAFLNRPLLDWPHGLTGDSIEHVQPRLFVWLRYRLDRPAVDGDIGQNRRTRNIPVPEIVVNELVVPDSLAGREIEGNQAVGKEVGARPMTAVGVAGWHLYRDVDAVELLIDRHLSPNTGIARITPRVLLPGVDAKFTWTRNRVKDPEPLAGTNVVAAHEPLLVRLAARIAPRGVSGAYDDRVAGDDRRCMQTDVSGVEIHRLVVLEFQIDDAALSKAL